MKDRKASFALAAMLVVLCSGGCYRSPNSELIEQLRSPDATTRSQAIRAVTNDGNDRQVVDVLIDVLIDALGDTNRNVRRAAIVKLRDFGASAASAMPPLQAALDDDRLSIRLAAALTMAYIDPTGDDHHEVLNQAIRDGFPGVMLQVGQLGERGTFATEALQSQLHDEQALMRAVAARCLGEVSRNNQSVTAAIERLARNDASVGVREAAQIALDRIIGKIANEDAAPLDERSF